MVSRIWNKSWTLYTYNVFICQRCERETEDVPSSPRLGEVVDVLVTRRCHHHGNDLVGLLLCKPSDQDDGSDGVDEGDVRDVGAVVGEHSHQARHTCLVIRPQRVHVTVTRVHAAREPRGVTWQVPGAITRVHCVPVKRARVQLDASNPQIQDFLPDIFSLTLLQGVSQ